MCMALIFWRFSSNATDHLAYFFHPPAFLKFKIHGDVFRCLFPRKVWYTNESYRAEPVMWNLWGWWPYILAVFTHSHLLWIICSCNLKGSFCANWFIWKEEGFALHLSSFSEDSNIWLLQHSDVWLSHTGNFSTMPHFLWLSNHSDFDMHVLGMLLNLFPPGSTLWWII